MAARGGGGSAILVVPGEEITSETGYLRGHGTHVEDGRLVANVAGVVERVNKLVSVRPLHVRYTGDAGDIVVGRVVEVGSKRWRVDVGGRQDAVLQLSSVNLSGGVQRRRTYEDQLNMRSFFREDDLVSAEVHSVFADGSLSLHARSLKYGKLENGQVVEVPPGLMCRLKQHFVTLPCGVDAILGLNGRIWLTSTLEVAGEGGSLHAASLSIGTDGSVLDSADAAAADAGLAEAIEKQKRVAAERVIPGEARARIARVANAIRALASVGCGITPDAIMDVYEESARMGMAPADLLHPEHAVAATEPARRRLKAQLPL